MLAGDEERRFVFRDAPQRGEQVVLARKPQRIVRGPEDDELVVHEDRAPEPVALRDEKLLALRVMRDREIRLALARTVEHRQRAGGPDLELDIRARAAELLRERMDEPRLGDGVRGEDAKRFRRCRRRVDEQQTGGEQRGRDATKTRRRRAARGREAGAVLRPWTGRRGGRHYVDSILVVAVTKAQGVRCFVLQPSHPDS